ncbi:MULTISPECIES: exodeoxyribonuclease III [Treponema]|uniref:Exodeoxyribonuclease (ExoA) n=7 Tax=Treponema TaxID=157 RepID=O83162_TREPA|nr:MULTISPECIES: exodeoxyribonuclease III [Treponema]AAC65116.1 exodeoxyribonuclease (exoA) [Treponema pallidum subsp. pallidum str. Nichols]ACD70552.1 exodeoxyribonuclease [Treponema pallidum subsp. pallidum SS14]ADD72279.1 exodeoxyribonuclease III [Treponema pallidum subsp. pallidum str. Chicago]ADR64396.1 exodeoxyribonuclease III [Treponema pallidum subsp. pallidum]ADR64415.1 exodeoxyribonuclease III [Treponema pallidum subsp. pallidum str. Mexico A]
MRPVQRIISWNVNGIRAIERKDFLSWLAREAPDVLCLQEIKAHESQLSAALRAPVWSAGAGGTYYTYFHSAQRPGYSGTALFSKRAPDAVRFFGVPAFDCEGRMLAARFGELTVVSAYFPNAQEGGKRLAYKLDFCAAFRAFCDEERTAGQHVILCGDYNIAHKEIDLAHPQENEGNPGFLPQERAWMDTFTEAGYADSFRAFCTEGQQYTWWSYRARARARNIGWRIDYQCVDQAFLARVTSSQILSEVTGSDHCPVCLTYAD